MYFYIKIKKYLFFLYESIFILSQFYFKNTSSVKKTNIYHISFFLKKNMYKKTNIYHISQNRKTILSR